MLQKKEPNKDPPLTSEGVVCVCVRARTRAQVMGLN